MTIRYSNSKFLTVFDPLPVEGLGWEAVAYHVGSTGDLNVMQRVYRATEMSGSKVRNEFGSGKIVIPKDDVLWDEDLPSPLTGDNPLDHEFLWRFYEGGVLRHEFFGQDINEDVAVDGESPRLITIAGRTTEICLQWGVHVPAWAEVQKVTLSNTAVSGSFTLKYGTSTTGSIAYNASTTDFETALLNISGLSSSDLEVSYILTSDGQREWTIRFVGQFILNNAVPVGFRPGTSTVSDGVSTLNPEVSDITQVDFYADSEPRTAASTFLDALARCQARGILTFLTPLFDETLDAFGEAWIDNDVQEISAGESLLSMMQRFSEAYGWEFQMLPGFRLMVVQAGFGVNRSLEARFWLGRHQMKHEVARTSRELLTRVWAQTTGNEIVQQNGTSEVSKLAREGWIDGFEGDRTFAQQVARTTYEERSDHVRLRSMKMPYEMEGMPRVFDDFRVNDWVAVEDDRDVMYVLKIESLSWRVGSQNPIDLEVTFFGEQSV